MKPTNRLRFVEREIAVPLERDSSLCVKQKVRILQQYFIQTGPYGQTVGQGGAWLDVPLETEE